MTAKEELTVKLWEIAHFLGYSHLWSLVAPRLETINESQSVELLRILRK